MEFIKPYNIFEISLVLEIKSSETTREIIFNLTPKYNIDLTSLIDPKEKYRNLEKSAFEFLSKPSAILFETETAALEIWSLNP